MATVYECKTVPMTATAVSLAGKQYYAVRQTTAGLMELCDTAGEAAFGIVQDEPAASKVGMVAISGTSRAVAGGTFDPGTLLKVTAAGKLDTASKAVVATNDGGSATDPVIGSNVFAKALDAGVDGRIIGVLILNGGAFPTTAA